MPGTTLTGPLTLVAAPNATAFATPGESITLAVVTGVDGTGSNAASKADVDARLGTIEDAINAILERIQ